jgi:hypothetical protein
MQERIFKITGSRELSMKSNEVNDHGALDRDIGQEKKLWVTPSLEIIALESAESGTHHSILDGGAKPFCSGRILIGHTKRRKKIYAFRIDVRLSHFYSVVP